MSTNNNRKTPEQIILLEENKSINDSEELRGEIKNYGQTVPKISFSSTNNPEFPNQKLKAEESLIEKTKDKDASSENAKTSKKTSVLSTQFQVYVSQFLSSWGDRMWMFAGGLFLIEITPGSLRLVAIYEAAGSLTVIFLGSAIGRWVDRTPRLKAAQWSLILQNLMVCLSTLLLCFMTTYKSFFRTSLNGWGDTVAQSGVVAMTCFVQIGTLASKLTIEKDWIVVISEENASRLSTMNSVLRTVDLSTQMMAPVLVGFVMTSFGMVAGGIVIGVWNVLSMIVEYGVLRNLYSRVVALQKPKQSKSDSGIEEKFFRRLKDKTKDAAVIWKSYFRHSIRDAGLGLAVLYMTVLAIDNYSRAYVFENGVSKGILGILTACASLSGILGSIAFPFLRRKIGVLGTGIFGYTFESVCLIFCVVSVFAPGSYFEPNALFRYDSSSDVVVQDLGSNETYSNTSFKTTGDYTAYNVTQVPDEYQNNFNGTNYQRISVILLLTGIVTSRFGLWIADLTVTQILQEEVVESERGGINGVQFSLNQSFSLLRSLLLIMLPTLATFGYLILLSFLFVIAGSILFYVYAFRKREIEVVTVDSKL